MNDNFSDSQVVRKRVVPTRGGVVAAQHKRAAQVGASVLEAGGDAVDAAVATSFAIGVVEPWMSGITAGGAMVLWRAKEQKAYVVDYGMRSPRALNPADYPLDGGGISVELYGWPTVKDNRNAQGATAVAVPGVVAGMALAHEKFGRLPWRELVSPAIELAREGMQMDWFAGVMVASNARGLSADPDAARMFLEDGRWPMLGSWTATTDKRIDQKKLADSLDTISREGAKAMYGGDLGAALARDIRDKGGSLALEDLAAYRAHFAEPLDIRYRDGRIYAAPGMTSGPGLKHAMELLPKNPRYVDYAKALQEMWRVRMQTAGDQESCTTHFSIADRHGNLCSVTQTLLSAFGARVVSPSTGAVLNNGIMWFDPEPGKPNSLAPGKRTLGNYCPVIVERSKAERVALGASGGRRIVGTVLQMASFLIDDRLSLEEAFHRPRIDMSGATPVIADQRIPEIEMALLRESYPVRTARALPFPYAFAVPAAVLRSGELNMGCTEVMSPWGDAVSERS
ncbi:MAG TPA: gamma-glutamyltransferase [Burkholderiales bacterium]|nr:gamma-glutamyltransferase [Burkholderiales bacterium]